MTVERTQAFHGMSTTPENMGGYAYSTTSYGASYSNYKDVKLKDGYVWSSWSTYTGSSNGGAGFGSASITVYFKDGTSKSIASFYGYVHKSHQYICGSAHGVSYDDRDGFSMSGYFENYLTKDEISNIDFIRCTAGVSHDASTAGNVFGQAYVYALRVPWTEE